MSEFKFTENQKKWIAALRSGDYEQTAEALQDENGYCCLGVGCKVASRNGIEVGSIWGVGTLEDYPEVLDWLGLYDYEGDAKNCQFKSLAELNDLRSYTFEMIADHLEAHPEQYFKVEGE